MQTTQAMFLEIKLEKLIKKMKNKEVDKCFLYVKHKLVSRIGPFIH